MKLAWMNIFHDRIRFAVTVAGIAFAVFLMLFQGSLLLSFISAASRLIDATDSDIWITPRGVACFDFSAPLPKRFLEISEGIPGVARASRMIISFAEYRAPNGRHHTISLVGAEEETRGGLPVPYTSPTGHVIEPDSVLVDRTSAGLLEVSSTPQEIEINRRRARVLRQVSGFSSFLGCPYVFTSYRDAARYLGVGPEETMYILVRVHDGVPVERVRSELQRRLPEADVLTRAEFSRRSQIYWITQTGAGGGILTAAILGFLIGLVVASQTIYATTMENLEEYATLKALGASRWFVFRMVLTQALICGGTGAMVGLAATGPVVELARAGIPWLSTPWWLPLIMAPPSLLMCCLAAVVSIRTALSVEPARVFRA
jgi:putative ABC transport system permease protein